MIQQQQSESIRSKIDLGNVKIGAVPHIKDCNYLHPQASYLHNFLEPYESFISQLVILLEDEREIADLASNSSTANTLVGNRILEIIRQTSKANFVFVLSQDSQDKWIVKLQSDLVVDLDQDVYIET